MKRSTFIKNLIGLYGLAKLPVEMVRQYQKIYLLQCFVRGFRFYDGPKLIRQINESGLLELVREPDNPYDKNAIALHFNKCKIGFLPAESNAVLARIMDADLLPLQGEVTHVEPKAASWENVHVAIYALKEIKTTGEYKDYRKYGILETPRYYTLKSSGDTYARVYIEPDEPGAKDYYQTLVDHSRDNSVYDLIHGSFSGPDEFIAAFDESKIVIREDAENVAKMAGKLYKRINGEIARLENAFGEDSYIVANVDEIANIPYKIERFVEILDKAGNKFYEAVFKA